MSDTELLHASHDEKADIGATLPESVFEDLPALILDAEGGLNTEDAWLPYAIAPAGKIGKVVVRVNYGKKGSSTDLEPSWQPPT